MARRLAAILAADVVGYSRLMAQDEAGTLAALKMHRRDLFDPETARRGGRIVKLMGDGVLVEFPSVVDAVECALAIQTALAAEQGKIRLRIGINLGDVIIDGDDIYGDGVNVAARLEALAETGGIAISGMVHEGLGNRVEAAFADAGEHEVKNISRPIHVWRRPATGPVRAMAKQSSEPPSSRVNIAVIGFAALSDDPQITHFARGFERSLVAELGKFTIFRVIGGEPLFSSESGSPGSDYIVEGSIRLAGGRVRVAGELRDHKTGEHVWSGKYDGNADDLLDFEDDAAHRMSGQLYQPLMKHAIARAHSLPAGRRRAIDHYLCAFRKVEYPTRQSQNAVRQSCQQALELDASFALVYELLAWINIHSAMNAWVDDPLAALEAGREAAATGIRHDDREAYLRSAFGLIKVLLGEADSGLRDARLAVEINPNDGEHVAFLATSLSFAGRADEALAMFDKADGLSPGYVPTMLFRGDALLSTGRFREAAECFEQAVLTLPDLVWGFVNLAVCYQQSGEVDKAQRAVAEVAARDTAMSVSYMRRLLTHRDGAFGAGFLAALQKAGLPE